MTRDEGWCAFRGFGQWDCDDTACENGAAFRVYTRTGPTEVCVLHLGYALAWDLTDEVSKRTVERLS